MQIVTDSELNAYYWIPKKNNITLDFEKIQISESKSSILWEAVIIPDNQQKSKKLRDELNVKAYQDGQGTKISAEA